jgi:exopolysaccharide biosynthesis polyprenyl glycosylphosphotransferase
MKHAWYLRIALLMADLTLLEAAFFGVYWWRFKTGMFVNPVAFFLPDLIVPSLIVAGYWVLLLAWFGLFRFDPLASRAKTLRACLKASAFGVLILFILTFDPNQPLPSSRVILASYGAGIFVIVAVNRLGLLTVLRELRVRGHGTLRTLLVGGGRRARHALHYLSEHPELGLKVRGMLADSTDRASSEAAPVPYLGPLSHFGPQLRDGGVEAVLIAVDGAAERQLGRLVRVLRGRRTRAFIMADQYPLLTGEVRPARIHGHPLVEIQAELLSWVERFFKRVTDVVLSLVLLVVTSPLWLVLSALIPWTSPGPVFHLQARVGLNGRVFKLLKFRSMRQDAEARTGAVLAVEGDPRVTAVGRWIRRTRLDELPQLINVLLGRMSIVGPRPERIEFVERFLKEVPLYARRLNVKPGLTGWSQVHLKYDRSADQIPVKLKYDFYYIENMSLPLDIKIMFMTLFVMLRGEGL